MIKISKKSQYGLRAMVCLAKNYRTQQIFSVKTISEKEGIPFGFLEKIILRLEKEKLVKGKKGVQGGYALSMLPQKISAKDIIFALENNKKPVDCAFCGRAKNCLTKGVWLKLETAFNKTLKAITLKDLIK
ncbi:MAG: Rrf2 family transcriptional regulator [Patescibacteria group bacterium]